MKQVVWTEAALADLDAILAYTSENYPSLAEAVARRIHAVAERIARWPESARAVEQRPGVRVVPLLRYPYRVFYREHGDQIEVLRSSRQAR